MLARHFAILIVLIPLNLFGQSITIPHISYTTDDGLPSSEVYDVLQDRDGYMWFSTDNGLSRFDGYEFKNYGFEEGLTDLVVFDLQEDSKGRIWMNSLTKKMFYYDKELEKIVTFKYNSKLPNNSVSNMGFLEYDIDKHDNLTIAFIDFQNIFILTIFDDGQITINSTINPDNNGINKKGYIYNYRFLENGNIINIQFFLNENENKAINKIINESRNIDWTLVDKPEFRCLTCKDNHFNYFELSNDTLISIDNKIISLNSNKNYTFFNSSINIDFCEEIIENKLLIGFSDNEPTIIFDLKNFLPLNAVDIISATNFFTSKNDLTNWITTKKDLKKLINLNYREIAFDEQSIKQLISVEKNKVLVILDNGENFILSLEDEIKTSKLFDIKIDCVIYDDVNEVFYATNLFCSFKILNNVGNIIQEQFFDEQYNKFGKKCIGQPALISGDCVYFKHMLNNKLIALNLKSKHFIPAYNNSIYIEKVFDIQNVSSGNLLLATAQGLFQIKNDSIIKYPTLHPYFNLRIEDIVELPDSTIVLGTKGAGVLYWMDDHFISVKESDGLTTNNVELLRVDSLGNVWVGTLEGLNKITFDHDGTPHVRVYSINHGLPSNEITDLLFQNEKIFVGTSKGLLIFEEPPIDTLSPKPIVDIFKVNNQSYNIDSTLTFDHSQNNIFIKLLTFNYNMNGKIPYQYRINNEDWVNLGFNREINFSDLSPGKYNFAFRSQNLDGFWSEATMLSIMINSPWWEWWSTRLIFIALLVALVYWIIKRRLAQVNKENKLKEEISDLEKSALAAQMNPHFIFNALNTIQNFIMKNDKMVAMDFLAKFAQLIRINLNSSVDNKISIQNESLLIDNYLKLEQLNHKSFEYSIEVDSKIDKSSTFIPPLLIQPFVENAVKHGISNVENGQIFISFKLQDAAYISVSITDNGRGMNKEEQKSHNYKSLSSDITEKRLNYLNESSINSIIIEDLADSKTSNSGTKVKLIIKMLES